MNKDFIKAVFNGTKSLMPLSEVHWCQPPHYDEISVRNLYPKFTDDVAFMKYMPDKLPKGKLPERRYFFNVLNTVHEEKTKAFFAHANKMRFQTSSDGIQTDEVLVTEEWWSKLNLLPYYSCKIFESVTQFHRTQGPNIKPSQIWKQSNQGWQETQKTRSL